MTDIALKAIPRKGLLECFVQFTILRASIHLDVSFNEMTKLNHCEGNHPMNIRNFKARILPLSLPSFLFLPHMANHFWSRVIMFSFIAHHTI